MTTSMTIVRPSAHCSPWPWLRRSCRARLRRTPADDPFATELVTARGIDVGEVKVRNDDTTLSVTYETTFPGCVLKTNLHVASDLAGIPKIKLLKTPNWLRFDFTEDVDCEGEITFDIPLDEIDGGVLPGDSVVVAARGERPSTNQDVRCVITPLERAPSKPALFGRPLSH
jgi:hypothetical protein